MRYVLLLKWYGLFSVLGELQESLMVFYERKNSIKVMSVCGPYVTTGTQSLTSSGDIIILSQSHFSRISIQLHTWSISEYGSRCFLMLMRVWHQQWDQSRAGGASLKLSLPPPSLTLSARTHSAAPLPTHTMRTCPDICYPPTLDCTHASDWNCPKDIPSGWDFVPDCFCSSLSGRRWAETVWLKSVSLRTRES